MSASQKQSVTYNTKIHLTIQAGFKLSIFEQRACMPKKKKKITAI